MPPPGFNFGEYSPSQPDAPHSTPPNKDNLFPQQRDSKSNNLANSGDIKLCKKCKQTLSLSYFYKDDYYCISCHNLINQLNKNKETIATATAYWKFNMSYEAFKTLGIFDTASHFDFMLPCFFSGIHKKKWHLYLYAFYEAINEPKKAIIALSKKFILSEQEILERIKNEHENPSDYKVIFPVSLYDLSIPILDEIFNNLDSSNSSNSSLSKNRRYFNLLSALFTRRKECKKCGNLKITHFHLEEKTNSLVQLWLGRRTQFTLTPREFKRSYSSKDGWTSTCLACSSNIEPRDLIFPSEKEQDDYLDAKFDPKLWKESKKLADEMNKKGPGFMFTDL